MSVVSAVAVCSVFLRSVIGHPRLLNLLPGHCGISLKPKPTFSLSPFQYCHTSYFPWGVDLPKSVVCVCVCSGCAHLVICVSLCVAIGVWLPQRYKPPGLILPLWADSECRDFSNPPNSTLLLRTPAWWDFVPDWTKCEEFHSGPSGQGIGGIPWNCASCFVDLDNCWKEQNGLQEFSRMYFSFSHIHYMSCWFCLHR